MMWNVLKVVGELIIRDIGDRIIAKAKKLKNRHETKTSTSGTRISHSVWRVAARREGRDRSS